ncbi:MAG: T9SS type A sorting domain-containing protein, partial [Saprospiraceae bacterium]|nr:T9SS type A sorting domain-containing protein [Saprospiraceae bacterium]
FDGANCHSGVYFNEPYVPFIENGGFYVKPHCEDVNDCCPLGTLENEPGGNCLFGYGPPGYAHGMVIGNRYCFRAPVGCGSGQGTECCPDGYSELIYGDDDTKYCYDPNIEIPAGFGGFTHGTVAPLSLYVVRNCPQEQCCPENANYVIPNGSNTNVAGKCWYANIPQSWTELSAPEDNRIVIYLVNQEECLNLGFQWNAQANNCYIEVPTNLANSLEIIGSSVYTNALPGCETHAVGPQDTRSEQGTELKGDLLSNVQRSISIFPNPASNLLNVRFDAEFSGPTVMKIFDSKGQLVETTTIVAPAKGSTLTLFLNELLPGNYFINVNGENHNETYYFIKL